jgi:imidazolonepropionase-like amidohydrolase
MPACEPRVALLGHELTAVEGIRVEIDDGRVAHVGEARGDVDALGRDLLLLPGFIDAHVHIGFYEPGELVAGGVTTARDLAWPPGSIFDLARRSRDPGFDGPLLLAVGPMLTVEGGYPTRAAWAPPGTGLVVDDESHARHLVGSLAEEGACAIKVGLNAAVGPTLPASFLEAIVEAAHARDLIVTGHVTGLDELFKAVEARIDELAHMLMSDERIPDDLLAEMVLHDITIVPTLSCRSGVGRAIAIENLRRFRERGGRVVYGTDLGNEGPRPGIDPREVAAMAEAGLSALDIIRSATVASAEWLGLEGTGRLEAGARADLIGVPLAALEDPVALTDVRLVIRGGRIVRRA